MFNNWDEQLIIHIQMLAVVHIKINNSSVCDMNSRFMQFQIEITNILQLLMMILWQQQQKSFFSVGVDLVGFLYFWVCIWFCESVYELPSLLTYRWFLFSFFLLSSSICGFFYIRTFIDTIITMTTVYAISDTISVWMHYCSLLDSFRKMQIWHQSNYIAIQHKINEVQSLIWMIFWLIHFI